MSHIYLSSLYALSDPGLSGWELLRLLEGANSVHVTAKELTRLSHEWLRISDDRRHDVRLRLREESPGEFALAAKHLLQGRRSVSCRIRCAMYVPELWNEVAHDFAYFAESNRMDYRAEFGGADDPFLASLPKELYSFLIGHLADIWWWRGAWTSKRLSDAKILAPAKVQLQLALLAGDEERIGKLLGASEKRTGYGVVWDFLQGRSQSAYLALKKLINRRRQGVEVFESWVALWSRLVALSQGDQQLFDDRRLGGSVGIERAFCDLSLQPGQSGQELELGRGLIDAALWIARQHHVSTLRLAPGVRDSWHGLGFSLIDDQLADSPKVDLLPQIKSEAPWQTFLRLLETHSELSQKTMSTSKSPAKSGALLWHLAPPEIVFYNDKNAHPELGPDKLGGRHVVGKTLLSRMPNYLDDSDRLAMAKVRLSVYGNAMISAEVLRLLVGHPRVYYKNSRVQLNEKACRLRLGKAGNGLRVQFWPEIPPTRDYLLEEDGSFWTRSPLEKDLQPLLENHAVVPRSAEKQLREALSKWADRIEVEAGEGLEPMQEAKLKVDQLVLRARPYSRGMRFEWLVRCTERSDYQRPAFEGREREQLVDEGGVVLVVRDFAWEQKQLEEYLAACPSLSSESSFRLESLSEVLELLQECQHAGVLMEWPEGPAWRVRRGDSLQVAVQQAAEQDWFTLEGSLQTDVGDSLDLQTALAAARLAQGSFLQLGENDFVRVSRQLQEQLEALADIADTEQPRIPSLAVPSLAELELTGLTSDAAFEERLETFQESRNFVASVPRRLEAELRDYQLEGFRWLARHARMGTGACLADDMGLGKTLQAITLMLSLRSEGPHLVVCPLSVLAQWEQQIEQFAPTLRAGQNRELKGLKAGDVVLCSYGVLLRDAKKLSKIRWSVAVLDEAQAIKNPQSKTARAAYQLQARVRIATTGTPIENRLSELWSLFAFLNPGLLGTLAAFRRRYEQAGVGRSRLRRLIAPFVLRRLKSQVLSELPPRTEVTLKVELSESELAVYEKLRTDAQRDLEEGQNFELLAHLTRLRQACCHPQLLLPDSDISSSKLEALLELMEQLAEGNHRALVFSQFTRFLDLVEERLKQRRVAYQRLDGSTSPKERKRRVEAFQDGEGDVFLISLKAGGTGLNLTGADYVVHLDPWWNPAAEDQASDRAHRIGQRRPVTVYRLVAENTLEEKVVRLHGHKRELAQSVLEGNEQASPLSIEELRELVRMA